MKERYAAHIRDAGARVRRVSCADSVHNVRSLVRDYARLGEQVWSRFRTRNRDDQLWAHDLVARAFLASGGGPLAGELNRAVDDLFRMVGVPRPR